MDRYFGFDLGDAESAVSRLSAEDQATPEELTIAGAKSFITACAVTAEGGLRIGEQACYAAQVSRRCLRFKSRFLTDPTAAADLRTFAAGVLGELYGSGDLIKGEDSCVYVGCPAGWDRNAREEYRAIFERAGYPPVKIVSESRAAMVSACQSKHLQVGYDILSKPVLVVDIGSSTTDFAYILGGREAEMATGGEVFLGGGVMDEILLDECVDAARDARELRKVFAESEPWRAYCEFKARRLKEQYFSDEAYWSEHDCSETVLVRYRRTVKLKLRMDPDMARRLLEQATPRLRGNSFRREFTEALKQVRSQTTEKPPELLFLTGGVSKMPQVRAWCREIFPGSVVIAGTEPEFSVSRGLAWSGRIDEQLRAFRQEIEDLRVSDAAERIVRERIGELYAAAVDAMIEPVIDEVVMPVFDRWRDQELDTLTEADKALGEELAVWLRSERAMQRLVAPITAWLRPVAEDLEEYTIPICVRHHVPYQALSLRSYLSAEDIDIRLEAKNLFPVQEITLLIDSIISILVGLLCGGSGVALVYSGPVGILAGAGASLLLLLLGKERMEKAILAADMPKPMRKLVPRGVFRARLDGVARTLRRELSERFEKDKNDEITARMVAEISQQIERCLTKMAEVVEIPLG